MDYKYMIVAFLEEQTEGSTLEPPKNPHITVKKKFKLTSIDETGLIELLQGDTALKGAKEVITGASEEYGSSENMITKVVNENVWRSLHDHFLELLSEVSESRDPDFEGINYLPHITWRLKGEDNLDPEQLENKKFTLHYLYLIERVHPTKSLARIVARIPLNSLSSNTA
jgi:hypothetical protein